MMRSFTAAISLWSSLVLPSFAQFVPAPTDLKETTGYLGLPVRYKEVPEGTCELTPGVASYSGYVDIADNEHIFFWFFEARNQDPTTAPLTIWINGGPGSSSMIGLFQENGPCRVDINGDVYSNPFSWNNVSNMIYIDQPSQTGFSYSSPIPAYVDNSDPENPYIVQLPNTTCPDYAQAQGTCGTYSYPDQAATANTTANAAPGMWKALQGFMGAFPQYAREELHFTTESYGGHYGPIFNEYFEQQNFQILTGQLPGAHYLNLRTVTIGNGWYYPLLQYGAYYNFTVSPGNTYDYYPYNASISTQLYNAMYGPGNCRARSLECASTGADDVCSAADAFCAEEVESVLDNVANRDEYDIREIDPDPFPYSFYIDYLNAPQLQQAIGAYVNFSESSQTVYTGFSATGDDNREDGTLQAVRDLLNQGVYVFQYAGDADYNCNWLGGQAISNLIAAPGFPLAGYVNISTPDNSTHGQVRQARNYAFARVYYSGHEVPFYQPLLALTMFSRAISGRDIATGKSNWWEGPPQYPSLPQGGVITNGSQVSSFREGISTVQFEVTPDTDIYNITTGAPEQGSGSSRRFRRNVNVSQRDRVLGRKGKRNYKPGYKAPKK